MSTARATKKSRKLKENKNIKRRLENTVSDLEDVSGLLLFKNCSKENKEH